MSHGFYYGVYLPSLARKVYFKELTIGQLKNIIKTILNNDDNALSFCFNEIVKENCREDVDRFELTTIDRFLALINMRVVSIGGTQKLQVTCDDTQKVFSTTCDYNQLIEQVEKIDFGKVQLALHNGISTEFGLPIAIRDFSTENLEINKLVSSIRGIKIGPHEYKLSSLDLYDIIRIIDNLPKSLTADILKYLESQEIKINKVNFLDIENPFTNKRIIQEMSLNTEVLNRVLKLAFKEDLHSLYKSIYYMVNILKFTPEYVEGLTMNEKQLYWSYYLADERDKQKSANNNPASKNLPIRDGTKDFLDSM